MLGERRAEVVRRSSGCRRSRSSIARSRIRSITSAGRDPVGAAGVELALDLVVQPGDPHHVELVEVVLVDRAEPQPLQQRHVGVLGELQDPLVEVEPGELAVEVEGAVLEVDGAVAGRRRAAPPALTATSGVSGVSASRVLDRFLDAMDSYLP